MDKAATAKWTFFEDFRRLLKQNLPRKMLSARQPVQPDAKHTRPSPRRCSSFFDSNGDCKLTKER